ncbi:hypothetical protein DEJ38_15175 [Kocuria rosea]|nr:hypothetical protein DEJ38_15175 [Kocuria rosea]
MREPNVQFQYGLAEIFIRPSCQVVPPASRARRIRMPSSRESGRCPFRSSSTVSEGSCLGAKAAVPETVEETSLGVPTPW